MLIRHKSTGEAVAFALEIDVRLRNLETAEVVSPSALAAPFDAADLSVEGVSAEDAMLLRLAGSPLVPEGEAPPADDPDERFGVCPLCGRSDGCVNVWRHHYFFCDAHRLAWYAGSNLFSAWHDEAPEVWKANALKLAGFRFVREGRP